MTSIRRISVAVVAVLAFASCSDFTTSGPPDAAGGDDGGVDWENYAPEVRTRIDRAAEDGNCAKLQEEFDVAEMNNDAQRERTGDGNADLMGYIDSKMSDAGCYG